MRRTPPAAQTPRHPTQSARRHTHKAGLLVSRVVEQQILPLAGEWVLFDTDPAAVSERDRRAARQGHFASCQFAPTPAFQVMGTDIGTRCTLSRSTTGTNEAPFGKSDTTSSCTVARRTNPSAFR